MSQNQRDGFRVQGAAALVTGAGKRLGAAVALALAAEGADVIVHYNTSAQAACRTCSRAQVLGVHAWPLQADLSSPQACEDIVNRCIEMAGRLDIIVHGASVFDKSNLWSLTPEDLQYNVQLHALASLQMGRRLAEVTRVGRIVNFLDTGIIRYDRNHIAYHLSKRTAFSLTRAMALEFAPGITVNAVAPGLILPPPGEDDGYLEPLKERVPLKRVGNVEAVVSAVLFLIENDYITGQVIFVDGGEHLRGGPYGL